jgi:imidazolonepropionase-like amidohydrolase
MRWLAIAALCCVTTPAGANDLIIQAAKVYTMTGAPLAPGMVRIADGKVVEVAAAITPPAGAKVIDLGTGTLIPGLIDAHNTFGIDGGSAESTLEVTPDFRVADGVDAGSRAFRRAASDGTTTVCLAPGTDNVVAGRSCIVKTTGRMVKPDHALVITAATDPAAGNAARNRPDTLYTRQPTNRMGVIWILRSEFGRAKAGGANSTLREALDGNRPVVCTSRIDADLKAALRLKQEYPMNLTIAGGHEAYKVKDGLAAAKVPVLLGRLTTTAGAGPEGSEVTFNNAGALHAAGVTFALTGGQLLDQARFAARFGLPREAALAAVTRVPAKLLGQGDRLGAIAPGRDADLVALSADPFDLSAAVVWTMTDGVPRSEDQ